MLGDLPVLRPVVDVERPQVTSNQRCETCGRLFRSLASHLARCQNDAVADARAAAQRMALYGLTEDAYVKLWNSQGGKCAICSHSYRLVVDHDHATGRVRGLLCAKCNTALGALGDGPALIRYLSAY